jgi:hypothetical protein
MTATTAQDSPTIDIERFSSLGLNFEEYDSLGMVLGKCLDGHHGTSEDGAVVVLLGVDGEDLDIVLVNEDRSRVAQLDKAIEALTKARNALA